jgi:hypothetical protein
MLLLVSPPNELISELAHRASPVFVSRSRITAWRSLRYRQTRVATSHCTAPPKNIRFVAGEVMHFSGNVEVETQVFRLRRRCEVDSGTHVAHEWKATAAK